jgi:hypothetical protein
MPSLHLPFKKSKEDKSRSSSSDDLAVKDRDFADRRGSTTSRADEDVPEASTSPGGTVGRASVFVDAEGRQLGEAAQNVEAPSVLLAHDGTPASGVPASTRDVETVITSGAKGLGPEGTTTLRSLQAEARAVADDGRDFDANAVVAPAKGAPRAALHSRSSSH